MTRKLFTLLFSCLIFSVRAQVSSPGEPVSLELALNKGNIPTIQLPEVDSKALLLEDSLENDLPMRFGFRHEVDINLISPENHQQINGQHIWRLRLICPEALSINLEYSKFMIPENAKFYVYDESGEYILGAFTKKNNKIGRNFATGLVPGARIILEFNTSDFTETPEIILGGVIHGYRDFFNLNKNFGNSGPCNINVNCPEGSDWQDQINSNAMIVLGNGTRWCSGAMINNTCQDGKPYFLTADHCLTGSVSNWLFYFNYQSPSCLNIDGPTNQIIAGSTLIANSSASDFALLRLDENPPQAYNVFYSGFSNRNVSNDTLVAIHHPSGDIKKISFSYTPSTSTSYLQNAIDTNLTHWRITNWDLGTTEGGSSGSPLYNSKKQIIGQLHGGYASCNSITSDWYGKMSYSWDKSTQPNRNLKNWLDPLSLGIDTLSGSYFPSIAVNRASLNNIYGLNGDLCNAAQEVKVNVYNEGSSTINKLEIHWQIPGVKNDTSFWFGTLNAGADIDILLDQLILSSGQYSITAKIAEINDSIDLNICDNEKSHDFKILNSQKMNLVLRTDGYAEETSLTIEDTINGQNIFTLGSFSNNTLDTFDICLPVGCYDFTIRDSWGDGLLGAAFFELILNGNIVGSGSGAFGNCTGGQMSGGCFQTFRICIDTVNSVSLPIAGIFISDSIINLGDTVFLSDISQNFPNTYSWTVFGDSGTANSQAQNFKFVPQKEGVYNVKLRVENIFGADSITIMDAILVESPLGISSNSVVDKLNIYPNPANQILNINLEGTSYFDAKILDLTGKLFYEQLNISNRGSIDISKLSLGSYIIQITTKDTVLVRQFIKQ